MRVPKLKPCWRRVLVSIIAILVSGIVAAAVAAKFLPQRGKVVEECALESNPVCADGVTFQSKCLAVSQGVTDYTKGSCKDLTSSFSSSFVEAKDEVITTMEMNRFQEEGFQFVGKTANVGHPPDPNGSSLHVEGVGDITALLPKSNKSLETETVELVRATTDGLVYVAKQPKKPSEHGTISNKALRGKSFGKKSDEPPPFLQHDEEDDSHNRSRNLGYQLSYVPHYWRYGELDYAYDEYPTSEREGGCSGTVVGGNKVLTAAHCVWDGQDWTIPSYFAPSRHRNCYWVCDEADDSALSSDSFEELEGNCHRSCYTREPYGRWPVVTATKPLAFRDPNTIDDAPWDFAILVLEENEEGEHIGSYLGAMPIVAAPACSFDQSSYFSGYPGGASHGSMWTARNCDPWEHACGSNLVLHRCTYDSDPDVLKGTSGAGITDSNERIVGAIKGVMTRDGDLYGIGVAFWPSIVDSMFNEWPYEDED